MFLSFLLPCLLGPDLQAQTVVLNEVVTSNTLLLDEDGDSPDWFELRNTDSDSVSIGGWTISDKKDQPAKWAFPNLNLAPNQHLLVWASDKNRGSVASVRTLINRGDQVRYLVPSSSVTAQWTSINFNDNSWSQGPTGLGYGDGDDATTVPYGTRSIFLRKSFNLPNPADVEDLLLHLDYDDGFVAYLNGTEVARANINGLPPAFDSGTITDQEAGMYQGDDPSLFRIEDPQGLLVSGENVLAIQVHNIAASSSDLTVIPYLTAFLSQPSSLGILPPAELQIGTRALHTNFKISSSGEGLYLFDEQGNMRDSIWIENVPTNVSLGRDLGLQSWELFPTPTPAAPNQGPSYEGAVSSRVSFSHPGGPVGDLTLTLSGAQAGEEIRYTLDADVPISTSPLYTGPLNINSRTVVRARIFRPGYIPSPTQTHSYLHNVNHDLPIVSLVTAQKNFFSSDSGIYVYGNNPPGDFPYFDTNIWEDWERPLHVSLYETDGSLGLAIDGGTKIFGGWSRAWDQRSLSFFARKKYGDKEIDYPLFATRPYDTYESFILRNSGNDFLNSNMRDITLTSLMLNSEVDMQAHRSVATYLNGSYFGMFHMREKISEHYLASLHDVDPDEVDLLEFAGDAIHGDNQEYQALVDFMWNNTLENDVLYQQAADQIDLDNFFQYQVFQAFIHNYDWPGNNIKFWKAPGKKWRWILYDTDFGFGIWDDTDYLDNALEYVLEDNGNGWPNPAWGTLFLRRLCSNTQGRNAFVNRFADELNTRFLPNRVVAHIDSMRALLDQELPQHYLRWSGSMDYQEDRIEHMKFFAQVRPGIVKQDILDEWNFPAWHALTVANQQRDKGYVQLNSLTLKGDSWTGEYVEGVPVKLKAIPEGNYVFSHWSGDISSTEDEIEVDVDRAMTVVPNFEVYEVETVVIINEINYQSSDNFDPGDWIELHNISNQAVDLTGWELKDNNDQNVFEFPAGTSLPAGGYLVIARLLDRFQERFPQVSPVIGDLGFGLSSQGESVRLYQANGALHDVVTFQANDPWPQEANGQGPTLELTNPNADNRLAENWAILHALGSPGQSNLDPFILDILDLKQYPNPSTGEFVLSFILEAPTTLSANLYDLSGRKVLSLYEGEISIGAYVIRKDLSSLGAGIYVVEFEEGSGFSKRFKWVKVGE